MATKFRELERKILRYPNRREDIESQRKRFKWICCDEKFTSVRIGGCKRGRHGFSPNGNSSISGQYNNTGTNRLDQTMIEEWEEACRNNPEYHEKWIILANEY